jgi:hypothetical protein
MQFNHFTFTANVNCIDKETKEVTKKGTFTAAIWSDPTENPHFPFCEALRQTNSVLSERENFFDINKEIVGFVLVHSVEISEKDYESLTGTFGHLKNGGQLLLEN